MAASNRSRWELPRIYEYKGSDGVVYWSFTRQPQMVSPPLRLARQTANGFPLARFFRLLALEAKALAKANVEAEEEEVW